MRMFVVVFLFWIISNFFVIIFRALMVAQWHLQQGMKLCYFGMCLGPQG